MTRVPEGPAGDSPLCPPEDSVERVHQRRANARAPGAGQLLNAGRRRGDQTTSPGTTHTRSPRVQRANGESPANGAGTGDVPTQAVSWTPPRTAHGNLLTCEG